jgi:hypothetical protein
VRKGLLDDFREHGVLLGTPGLPEVRVIDQFLSLIFESERLFEVEDLLDGLPFLWALYETKCTNSVMRKAWTQLMATQVQ